MLYCISNSYKILSTIETAFIYYLYMQAPRVCPGYQIGSYNISIYAKNTLDNSSSLIYHFGPADYTQVNVDERTLLAHELRSGIYQGSHYEVEVTVESYSMIRTRRKSFCKLPLKFL